MQMLDSSEFINTYVYEKITAAGHEDLPCKQSWELRREEHRRRGSLYATFPLVCLQLSVWSYKLPSSYG